MDIIMIKECFEKNYINYALIALAAYGVLVKGIVAIVYARLICASENMGASDNKLMKLLRMKFETCYKLKIGVKNVDSFVDKYIYKYKFMGILLYTWEGLGGQVLITSMLVGAIAIVIAVVSGCGQVVMLSTLLVSISASSLLVITESMLNLSVKKRVLRVNIVDYLDNFLKARLENEYLHPEELEEYRKAYFTEKSRGEKAKKSGSKEKLPAADKEVAASTETPEVSHVSYGRNAVAIDEGMQELIDSIRGDMGSAKKQKDTEVMQGEEAKIKKRRAQEVQIIEEVLEAYLA